MDKMKKVKKKRKMAKNLTLPHWDLNPRFLNKTFPSKIRILREIRSIELTEVKISRLYLEFNYDFEKAMTRCEPEKRKKKRKKGRLSIK